MVILVQNGFIRKERKFSKNVHSLNEIEEEDELEIEVLDRGFKS